MSGELYGEALNLRMLSYGAAVASNKIDSKKEMNVFISR